MKNRLAENGKSFGAERKINRLRLIFRSAVVFVSLYSVGYECVIGLWFFLGEEAGAIGFC